MNKHLNRYNESLKQKLRFMQSKQPKDYWKYLNQFKRSELKSSPNIDDMMQHLRSVINDPSHDHDDSDSLSEINSLNENICLNGRITQSEIDKCIIALKNRKSTGLDQITNEYIKHSKRKLLPVYEIIFNTIFDTGFIPSQ